MKLIIVGCGKIGVTLISSLSAEGHDVVAIDNNAATVAEITNTYDVMSVCGNGVDCETLIEADVEKAELPIKLSGFCIVFAPDGEISVDDLVLRKGEFAIVPESAGMVNVEGEGEVIYVTM